MLQFKLVVLAHSIEMLMQGYQEQITFRFDSQKEKLFPIVIEQGEDNFSAVNIETACKKFDVDYLARCNDWEEKRKALSIAFLIFQEVVENADVFTEKDNIINFAVNNERVFKKVLNKNLFSVQSIQYGIRYAILDLISETELFTIQKTEGETVKYITADSRLKSIFEDIKGENKPLDYLYTIIEDIISAEYFGEWIGEYISHD